MAKINPDSPNQELRQALRNASPETLERLLYAELHALRQQAAPKPASQADTDASAADSNADTLQEKTT
jgi:hypothetical protein